MKYIRIVCVVLIVLLSGALVSSFLEINDLVDDYNSSSSVSNGNTSNGNTSDGSNPDIDDGENNESDDFYKKYVENTSPFQWHCKCVVPDGSILLHDIPYDLHGYWYLTYKEGSYQRGAYKYYVYYEITCKDCGEVCPIMYVYYKEIIE